MGLVNWWEKRQKNKAQRILNKYPVDVEKPQAAYFDPLIYLDKADYKENPSTVYYDWIRGIFRKDALVASVVQTIINAVADFGVRPRSQFDLGTKIRMKDVEGRPSPADKKEMRSLERIIFRENLGPQVPTLEQFYRAFVRDLILFDQGNFEVVFEKGNKDMPAGYWEVDAATVRLAKEEDKKKGIFYKQIIEQQVIQEFKWNEMAWCLMNPRNDVKVFGYGYSPIEMLIHTITSHIWAEEYNRKIFTQGSMIKGFLNIKDQIPKERLAEFRTNWYQLVSGINNAWRTPVFSSPSGIEWVRVQDSNRDMEFGLWMEYLIRLVTSIFQVDPISINFSFGNVGQTSSLGNQDNEAKIKYSRIKFLRPILRCIESAFNKYLIDPRYNYESPFEVTLTGLDVENERELAERLEREVSYCRTVNEVRSLMDLPALEEYGDIILNGIWLQEKQMQEAKIEQAAQQEMMAEQGISSGQEEQARPQKKEVAQKSISIDLPGGDSQYVPKRENTPFYEGWADGKMKQPALNEMIEISDNIIDVNIEKMYRDIIEVIENG